MRVGDCANTSLPLKDSVEQSHMRSVVTLLMLVAAVALTFVFLWMAVEFIA